MQKHITGKEEYIEKDGKKYMSPDFLCMILKNALFWKEIRMDSMKRSFRTVRRSILYGTTTPGGPDVEVADPQPE